jgi:hypothetical protein
MSAEIGGPVKSTEHFPLTWAYPFGSEHGLQREIDDIRKMEIEWDRGITSSVRRGYIIRLFQSKGIFEQFQQKYWPSSLSERGKVTIRRYLRYADEYDRFIEGSGTGGMESEREEPDVGGSEFAFETDLRDYLAKNLNLVEPGLSLYSDERGAGVEYRVDNGRIDILARDKLGNFLVLELKVSEGRNKTLGQILYYMGWVDRELAKGKKVRGAIIAKEVPEDLKLACTRAPEVHLFEYDLQVSLRKLT